jgi:hypothetical protein
MTAVGEFYWNFGIPGVLVGMTMIGAFLGAIWRIAGPNPASDPFRMLAWYTVILADQPVAGAVIVSSTAQLLLFVVLIGLGDHVAGRLGWIRVSVRASLQTA